MVCIFLSATHWTCHNHCALASEITGNASVYSTNYLANCQENIRYSHYLPFVRSPLNKANDAESVSMSSHPSLSVNFRSVCELDVRTKAFAIDKPQLFWCLTRKTRGQGFRTIRSPLFYIIRYVHIDWIGELLTCVLYCPTSLILLKFQEVCSTLVAPYNFWRIPLFLLLVVIGRFT